MVTHLLRDRLDRLPTVERNDAVGESLDQLTVRIGHGVLEPGVLALDPVELVAETPPAHTRLEKEEERARGLETPGHRTVQLEHGVDSESTADALIDE